MSKLQIISDVHIEFRKSPPNFQCIAPILILAGDIGTIGELEKLLEFLNDVCSRWKHVIYVPGNHEYYHSKLDFETIWEKLKSFENQFDNLYVLDNERIEIDGIGYVGSTLWSQPVYPYQQFNDFNKIRKKVDDRKMKITIYDHQKWNVNAHQYLTNAIQPNDVVITHFMPETTEYLRTEFNFISKYETSESDLKYYGNSKFLGQILKKTNPRLWISGHTHESFDVTIPNTQCRWLCHPMGYDNENLTITEPKLVILK